MYRYFSNLSKQLTTSFYDKYLSLNNTSIAKNIYKFNDRFFHANFSYIKLIGNFFKL